MTDNNNLYERDQYLVRLASNDYKVTCQGSAYNVGYEVVNNETGVTEFRSPCLPDCMHYANASRNALVFFREGAEQAEELVDIAFLEGEEVQLELLPTEPEDLV